MSRRWAGALMVMLGFALLPAAHASPPEIVQAEINYLLGRVASSGCEFYRNGSWYDGRRAEAHLRSKYDALVAKDLIRTTDDFIELAGTRSSFSGREYAIRCSSSAAVPSNQWLREQLTLYRRSRQ